MIFLITIFSYSKPSKRVKISKFKFNPTEKKYLGNFLVKKNGDYTYQVLYRF